MKKQNNRFRNGNNNNGYTLNYKFDSVSIAGKISGTALDLIRRYNDLAKEAQSCGNYVDMEIYRQYAEHYRKIVTDINERRQSRFDQSRMDNNSTAESEQDAESQTTTDENTMVAEPTITPEENSNGYVETLPATEPAKSFQVVEITEPATETTAPKAKRVYRRRQTVADKTAEA